MAAVDVRPIVSALRSGARLLAALQIPQYAPPAFLLDSRRSGTGRTVQPDQFDNRSICFTTDFPSATYLGAHGIHRALLVQRTGLQPQPDLAHTLRRWQEASVALERVQLDFTEPPERFEVTRPSWYGAIFQRALSMIGLRRAEAGGFGAWVQDSPASG